MKKSLRVAASFFVLGTLWMSPLHAMEEEKENRCTGDNIHQIRKKHNKGSGISSRLFLEERSGFNLNDILKEQGSENAFHDFKRNEKAFHDLEESFKNNQILKKQKNEKAVHNLEQSFEKLRLLFLQVPNGSEVDNSQMLKSPVNSSGKSI